jgi:hypothetical protein
MKKGINISKAKELEEEEFQLRIMRDADERPSVVCCKMPTPRMGLSFDLTIINVGSKDVRIRGKVERIKPEGKE